MTPVDFGREYAMIIDVDDRVETVYERIVARRKAIGSTTSERSWCSSIGLSPTYLSQLRARCKDNPKATVDTASAIKISNALGMNLLQLLGLGPEDGDPYPERQAARTKAVALGFSAEAIQIGCDADPPPGTSGNELFWFGRIQAAETLLKGSRPSAIIRSLGR